MESNPVQSPYTVFLSSLQNGAKFVTKEGRKAVIFDGDNDYAQIKSFDARTSDLTIAFWFRVKSLPTAMNLFNDVKDSKRQFNFRSSNDRSLTIEMKTKGKMIIATTAKRYSKSKGFGWWGFQNGRVL